MTFGTLDYVRRLRRADVPEQQAEAMADALQAAFSALHGAANKQDILELRDTTKQGILELRASFTKARDAIRHDLGQLEAKIEALENRLTIKLTGITIAIVGIGLAILRLTL